MASRSLASAMRICQPPLNSSVCRDQSCLLNPKPGQNRAYLGVEGVAVEGVEALLEEREPFGGGLVLGAGVVEFGKLGAEALDFAFHVADFVEDGQAFLEDGAAGEAQAFLRQVADAHAAGLLELAVVEGFQAGENLHQGGLAGAVGADEGRFFPAADKPVGLKEQDPGAEPFAGILQGEHSESFSQRGIAQGLFCTRYGEKVTFMSNKKTNKLIELLRLHTKNGGIFAHRDLNHRGRGYMG